VIYDEDDADQLDRHLDDLGQHHRQRLAPNGFTSEAIDAAVSIHFRDRTDLGANPRPGFLAQLEEQLDMHASTPVLHLPDRPFAPIASVNPARSGKTPLIRTLRHPVIGSLATAALLLITLSGVYLTMLTPRDGSGSPTSTFGAFAPGSPEAGTSQDDFPCVETYDVDFGCATRVDSIGSGYVWPDNYNHAALQARSVQLQGWAIMPGKTLTGATADSATSGVVTDFVISGAYVATFNVPVVVVPGGWTNDPVQYLDAGQPAELVRGSTVTYQLGGLVEIHNPLDVQRLEFKRAVIYQGDISAFSATSDGVTTRGEADGTVDNTPDLAQIHPELWYVNLKIGESIPPVQSDRVNAVVGPTDPQRGPEGTEGFVLVIRRSEG
jgi:hypothetical protein